MGCARAKSPSVVLVKGSFSVNPRTGPLGAGHSPGLLEHLYSRAALTSRCAPAPLLPRSGSPLRPRLRGSGWVRSEGFGRGCGPECRPASVPPGPQTAEAPGGCLASGLWVRARGDTRPETRRQPGRRQFSGCFPSGQLGNTPSPPGWGPEPGTEEALGERGTTWHMWAPGAEGEAGAPLLHEDGAR